MARIKIDTIKDRLQDLTCDTITSRILRDFLGEIEELLGRVEELENYVESEKLKGIAELHVFNSNYLKK